MVAAGNLRDLVAFEVPSATSGEYGEGEGETKKAWLQVGQPVRAQIHPLRGTEQVMQSRLAGVQPVVVTVHWRQAWADLDTTARLRDVRTSDVYSIQSITDPEDGKRRWLDVLATRGRE